MVDLTKTEIQTAESKKISINRYLKKIRQHVEMSQMQFSKTLGVTQSTLSKWESTSIEIPISGLKKIHNYCKSQNIEFDIFKLMTD